jgi:hypothetical protein
MHIGALDRALGQVAALGADHQVGRDIAPDQLSSTGPGALTPTNYSVRRLRRAQRPSDDPAQLLGVDPAAGTRSRPVLCSPRLG